MNDHDSVDVIKLAYQASTYAPPQEDFRRGRRKKTYNPLQTAPTLNKVITHLEGANDFQWMKRKARLLVLEKEAAAHIDSICTLEELRQFLATFSLFLKVGKSKGTPGMKKYEEESRPEALSTAQAIDRAYQLSEANRWNSDMNLNKLTKLAARVRGCRSKSECLGVLAQNYPLSGIPKELIDNFVGLLGRVDVSSFQQVVNQTLVFYKAQKAQQKENS